MKKRNHGTLTKRKLLHLQAFAGMTEGNALAHRFCDAVNAGSVPDTEDLQAVAFALEVLRDGNASDNALREFADRFRAKKKPGKGKSTEADWMKNAEHVVRYYIQRDEYLAEGETENDANVAARALVASDLGIKDRAMLNKIKKYEEEAKWMYESYLFWKEVIE